ncbi:phosphoribosyl-AMP cyclohydrolase [Terrihabitans rhizophilus]|uniref:Phosphoribosyl-AMP cyclohydrolase n=1 Tax=Terrihabitans rhizophilus TaxID=3092662 RepID=A0ABU4RRY9_9HYPH|nr:phosphoribosyl-AMP cyclohydrolase [Terrihabitans sp. PJ23]MDX6807620.1 phosphoribosyl-AMP cyclohydrolase [Terrihabitans sp. PJ23]
MSVTFAEGLSKSDLEDRLVLAPRFDASGLVTCVVTDAESGMVLMLAHMNAEALAATIETREAHYWSRSRNRLWKKGEDSGHVQDVVEMRVDCDQDAVLLKVRVRGTGASCHTGRVSCFYRTVPLGDKVSPDLALSFADADRLFDPANIYGKTSG